MKQLVYRHLKSLTAPLENHNGQMAIFVALIFQVLFVAFAMAINIGLIVHDKINLQNSVDLAAYYAAERQAEQLNIIAHENYQIRQSYKLMSWRYNVLGSIGRDDHPVKPQNQGPLTEAEYGGGEPYSVCVAYNPLFAEVGKNQAPGENMCRRLNVQIPSIKLPGVIAGFNPINIIFQNRVKQLITQLKGICQDYGALNFYMAAGSIGAFRRDQTNRKQIIFALAQNMAKPIAPGGMADLDGNDVYLGVRKTLKKNLTYENGLRFNDDEDIQIFNSVQAIPREDWLHELPVTATMIYTDISNSSAGYSCAAQFKTADQGPNNPAGLDPAMIKELQGMVSNPPPGDINQLSLGVEKNPWMMVYVGVKAKTRPREIFWPFSNLKVEVEAKGFAQPFGGRIGPWYFSTWAPGAKASSGDRVDALALPLAGSSSASKSNFEYLPNYSRYPGDSVGLKAVEAQAAMPSLFNLSGHFGDYSDITNVGPQGASDILAYNAVEPGGGQIRQVELSAIVPDLFDITYYSIEPQFNRTYLPRLRAAREKLGIPDGVPIRGDLGSRMGPNGENVDIGVYDQMKIANGEGGPVPILRREDYWNVRNREHLLVDWVHGDSFEVMQQINAARFGKCGKWDDKITPTPGSCIGDGGRTGYSVKIVSPKYLRAPDLALGGQGIVGPILNPPPEGF